MSNREIDFGFGRGAVRVCVRACVRACEAVCGREDDDSSGAGPKNWKFVGVRCPVAGARCPVPAPPPGRYQKLKIKLWFCRDLIASRHAATQKVCFLWVSVPKSLQNFVFFSLPAGPDPPAPLVPLVPFGALEKRTTPARELHF